MYMEMYNSDMHYGKTIHILQSSGTGKSRLVAELGKSVRIGFLVISGKLIEHPESRRALGNQHMLSWRRIKKEPRSK